MAKLSDGSKHLMRLAAGEADLDGWTTVSKVVWPAIALIPDELIEKKPAPDGDGGLVRITDIGEAVLRY